MSLPTNFFIGRGGAPQDILSLYGSDMNHRWSVVSGSLVTEVGTAVLQSNPNVSSFMSTGNISNAPFSATHPGSESTTFLAGGWISNGSINYSITNTSHAQSYWVYTQGDSSGYWMFFSGNTMLHMYNQSTNVYRIGSNDVPTSFNWGHQDLNTTGTRITQGNWQHFIWSHQYINSTTWQTTVYRNGTQVSQDNATYNNQSSYAGELRLGYRDTGGSQWAQVLLDNVTIWNRGLSASEAADVYTLEST